MNGNNFNGNNGNGNGKHHANGKADARLLLAEKPKPKEIQNDFKSYKLEQPQSIILRQSPIWSRAILAALMVLAVFGVTWAYFAKIEQVVPATGQLKPEGTNKEVQAPVNGVVKNIYIKDGQQVKAGDLLLTFDSAGTNAELQSLNTIKASLLQENQIYRNLMNSTEPVAAEVEFLRGKLPQETVFILKNRASLLAENELLRTELKSSNAQNLGNDEQIRLQTAQKELAARTAAVDFAKKQINQQIVQNQLKISNAKVNLNIESGILAKMKILAEEGGISQLQYLQQQQKVQDVKAQIAQLVEETPRLDFQIQQGKEELNTTVAVSHKNLIDKIAENKKRMAEIDSQLNKVLIENNQRLAETNGKIAQAQMNFKYQELRAPVEGKIFDLQAKYPGFVANSSQKVLTIVPNQKFIAEAFITNKDIGFVREGMKVDVRIDSFPYSEFGDIKGKIVSIASDALPPDQVHQFYRFPVRISLDKQSLNIRGRNITLQSGMSVTANIKIREERSVMSLFTEMFTKQTDSLKEIP
jgi:hemolysin D